MFLLIYEEGNAHQRGWAKAIDKQVLLDYVDRKNIESFEVIDLENKELHMQLKVATKKLAEIKKIVNK